MLLDTSGLLCLVHKAEIPHAAASAAYQAATRRLTHSHVLSEFIALAQVRGVPRPDALRFVDELTDDASIDVYWVDEALHREAIALLHARLDKTYSLCDAISFVLMRRFGVGEALTTDRHFEQEGFRKLLS